MALRDARLFPGTRRFPAVLRKPLLFGLVSAGLTGIWTGSPEALPTTVPISQSDVHSRVGRLAHGPALWRSTGWTRTHPLLSARFSPLTGETLPLLITASPQSATGGVDPVSISVRVGQTGGSIQIGTTQPLLLNSPSQSWPHVLSYPSGGPTTRTITVSTNPVTVPTVTTVFACPSGVDASNPANWTVSAVVTILP
jgi:hypothetical protein